MSPPETSIRKRLLARHDPRFYALHVESQTKNVHIKVAHYPEFLLTSQAQSDIKNKMSQKGQPINPWDKSDMQHTYAHATGGTRYLVYDDTFMLSFVENPCMLFATVIVLQ